jgi:HD-GYP domain-containing protein (c-di-GMP phosphodiesterase class II)
MSDLVRGRVPPPADDPDSAIELPPDVERTPVPAVPPGEGCAAALTGELQRFVEGARYRTRTAGTFPWGELADLIERAVDLLADSGELFWVAADPTAPARVEYLAFHQARVAVLALQVGTALGYDRARLLNLGVSGCLIDVGLWDVADSLGRAGATSPPDEQSRYRLHPQRSAEIIRGWSPPDEGILDAVLHHHEREHGQGFPDGLSGAAISSEAGILGLVDHYAGLTAPPPPQAPVAPHEAIREIARTRPELFAPALVKAFLSEISIFPPGSLVRLNTGEIGRVTAVHREHPLRPRLEVARGAAGQALSPRIVELSAAPTLHITGSVSDTKI